jgi:hypothetical protein|tara:strand:- start:723 stop:1118 length:396 start_codon:yes stop_codon:yes gene_type:complete
MKVLGGVSHAETQWDNIEKARFVSLYALAPEVVSSVKNQLELALGKGLTFKYRGIATAIIISGDFFQQGARFTLQSVNLNTNTLSGASQRSIQYVCGKASHKVLLSCDGSWTAETSGPMDPMMIARVRSGT